MPASELPDRQSKTDAKQKLHDICAKKKLNVRMNIPSHRSNDNRSMIGDIINASVANNAIETIANTAVPSTSTAMSTACTPTLMNIGGKVSTVETTTALTPTSSENSMTTIPPRISELQYLTESNNGNVTLPNDPIRTETSAPAMTNTSCATETLCSSKLFKELKMPVFEDLIPLSLRTDKTVAYTPPPLNLPRFDPTRAPPGYDTFRDETAQAFQTRDAVNHDMFMAIQTLGETSLSNRIALQQSNAGLTATTTNLTKLMGELQEANRRLANCMSNQQENITTAFTEMNSMREISNDNFKAYDEKIATCNEKMTTFEQITTVSTGLIQNLSQRTTYNENEIAKMKRLAGGVSGQVKSLPFTIETLRNLKISFTNKDKHHPHQFLAKFNNYFEQQLVDEASKCHAFRGVVLVKDEIKDWGESSAHINKFTELVQDFLEEFWCTSQQEKALLAFQEELPRIKYLREMAGSLLRWIETFKTMENMSPTRIVHYAIGKVAKNFMYHFVGNERSDLDALIAKLKILKHSHEDEIAITPYIVDSNIKRSNQENEGKRRTSPRRENHKYRSGDRRYPPENRKYLKEDRRYRSPDRKGQSDRGYRSDNREYREPRNRYPEERSQRPDGHDRKSDSRGYRSEGYENKRNDRENDREYKSDRRYRSTNNRLNESKNKHDDSKKPEKEKEIFTRKDFSRSEKTPKFRERKPEPETKTAEQPVRKIKIQKQSEEEEDDAFSEEYTPGNSDEELSSDSYSSTSENLSGED
ncbi:hypothetical protein U1Q18_050490 [Sarracenia purpurea var. burkii]